jgi:hypothetical protein
MSEHAIAKSPTLKPTLRVNFFFFSICSCTIVGMGRMNMTRSSKVFIPDVKKFMPIMFQQPFGKVSRFQAALTGIHWKMADKVVKTVNSTTNPVMPRTTLFCTPGSAKVQY